MFDENGAPPPEQRILPLRVIDPLLDLLESLKGIPQMEKHHPEGDVFVHSLQVLHHAFREEKEDLDLILAAMLHDIGKKENPLGHEQIGAEMIKDIVSVKTQWLITHHLRIRFLLEGKIKRTSKVRYLVDHPWLPELILLARWDRLGRNPSFKPKYDREKIIEGLEKVAKSHFKNTPKRKGNGEDHLNG